MARCGCEGPGGACSCAIVAGTNVVVSGTGNPGSPYQISAAGPGEDVGYLQVTDTDSIDHTLSGTGVVGDPWNVSSDVNVDPDDTNLIQITEDGLLVSCASVQACAGAESPGDFGLVTVGCGLGGDGTPGDPITLLPSHTVSEVLQTQAGPFNFPAGTTPALTRNIINASDCFDASVIGFGRIVANHSVTNGNLWELSSESGWDGVGTVTGAFAGARAAGTAAQKDIGVCNSSMRPQRTVIGPGANDTYRLRCFASGGVGGAGDTFSGVRLQIYLVLILNPIP